MLRKISITLGLATIALSSALASQLSPGDTGKTPDALTVSASATLVANVSGTFTSGTFTANYLENVYSDPTNMYCAGCLDWVIRIQDTGAVGSFSGIIERITSSSFMGFLTDVGTDTNGAPGLTNTGTVTPYTVDRSGDGSVIGWNFTGTGGANEIHPGQTSVLLEIETNAQGVTPGFLSAIDGGSAQANAYGAGAPEPMSLGLIGGGLAVLGIARLRRRAKA